MRKQLSLAAILVSILSLFWTSTSFANPNLPESPTDTNDVYEYPIRPGSDTWFSFETHAEMVSATQLPNDVLQDLSTEGLLHTVLDYPLLGEIFAFNSTQQGFTTVASRFNGLEELLQRPDVGKILLAHYEQMDPRSVEDVTTTLDQGRISADFAYVETLLAQEEVLRSLSEKEQLQLLEETLAKSKSKQTFVDVYGIVGQEHSVFVMAKVLQHVAPSSQAFTDAAVSQFTETGSMADVYTLNALIAQAHQILGIDQDTILALEGDTSIQDHGGVVHTPNGTRVPVVVVTTELTPSQISEYNSYVATNYPSATRETNASHKYNCHSYAWYSTSTSNNIWMNTPGDDRYWQDGSYVSVDIRFQGPNDRISYASDDHSAIVAYSPTGPYMYRSKWGQLPRMYHALNYSPYNSSTLKAYRRP